ncbi:MAG TPA: hypothetical protein VIF64_03770 [Pyrinomonadaceae bacterium]
MRYLKMKRVMIALVVLLTVAAVAALASADNFPSQEERAAAEKTGQLMHNELFAALIQEFNETTPENVEEGKHAISLIFNNSNRDIRLIGIVPPLQGGFNNLPSDPFERKALTRALQGLETTSFERIADRWYYRRSDALSNTFHPNCVLCHQSFANLSNPGQWVGALTMRVPIGKD